MKRVKPAQFVRDHFVAISSFLLIFFISIFLYSETKKKAEERSQRLFEIKATQATDAIRVRMNDYIQILIGAKAFFVSSDTVERKAWRDYYSHLNLEDTYPGIQGIGYSHFIKPEELTKHINRVRKEGFPDYAIRPSGERDIYSSIILLEPFGGRNLRAFGYDMFSEPIRQSAMRMARDTKQPAMTSKVQLVQETGFDVQAGFLIYLPIYWGNADPESIQDRQQQIKGFVYSPFRAKDLMHSILGDDYQDIDIEVYDGSSMNEASLLYSTDSVTYYGNKKQRPFTRISTLSIGNNMWRIFYSAKPGFARSSDAGLPYFILLGGSIISFLMFFIIWSLSNTRKSNRLKQTITDNATAALFMMDAQGYCTFMNPAAEEMTGYTFEEIREKPLHYMVHYKHPDGSHYPLEECPLDRALPTNNDVRAHEDVFIKKDGTFFSVTCAARPIMENGIPLSTIIEVRDITDEKRAQQTIIESESRFRTMADSAPVVIWVADIWGQYVYVNKQWSDFTGLSYEESISAGWQGVIEASDAVRYEKIFKNAVSEAKPFKLEMQLFRHDSQLRWVVNTGMPRYNMDGEFLGHIGSIIDITEIKEAERKVKQNAELLQKLFLEVPASVALLRAPDLQYVLANPPFRKLYQNRPLVGKLAGEIHTENGDQDFLADLKRIIETGEAYIGNEVAVPVDVDDKGHFVNNYFNAVYQPLIDSYGKIEAVLVFAVEVTELVAARKKMTDINDELSEKNNELLRINNDLDNFVYTASHDLKSPIANMEGIVTLLRDIMHGKLSSEDEQILDMAGNAINKLKETIADLAEITKVQKELQSSVEPLQFANTFQDVKSDIQSLIDDTHATIKTDFKVKDVLYARKNLRSIFYNLVSNAIKYRSPDRPAEVSVKTYKEGDYTVLEVSDNGLGIKKEQHHKLFSMFKRLHTHVEGSGIGLYIVKRIIENNHGKITVESDLDKGTTFKVYFNQANA